MKLKLNLAFRAFELLAVTLCAGLLAGCSSEESIDMPAPKAQAQAVAAFDTSAVLTATAPEAIAPPTAIVQAEAAVQPVVTNAQAVAGEVPLYNIAPEDLMKHPKWGPVLQKLSQACVAFFAAEKRVPGSVAEMEAKGFTKDVPAAPEGMMFQIDAANYRVMLVSM
ncbi:MAG TPA: fimbrillin family protein [Verrucomicrobiae bacterium]